MNLVERVSAANEWNFFKNLPTGSSSTSSLVNIVDSVISLLLMIAGAAAIIYLIYSGILYITAAGNPDAAKKGQQGVINAVIGIVIIALAYVIAKSVFGYAKGTLGV